MPKAKVPATPQTASRPAGMTADGWPIQARLRLEHPGPWVAWSEDLRRHLTLTPDGTAPGSMINIPSASKIARLLA